MISLDSKEDLLRHDPKGMYSLTCDFPQQVKDALATVDQVDFVKPDQTPTGVVLTGMGGSAAGGDFVAAMFDEFGQVPFLVNRDYSLPSWVNSSTLVFATSYSGNTEETLAAYDQAKALGCQIVIVTSGGKLADLGAADGYPVIRIPAGQPPRTAMGFLMMPVLEAAVRMGLLPSQNYQALNSCLEEAVKLWAIEVQGDANPAKVMAKAMFNKPVVVYGLGSWQGAAASRWKGQICENAKAMCFAHTYPELCHNELLGWVNADKQSPNGWALVTLRSGDEIPKMAARGAIVPELIQEQATNIFADCIGDTLLEKMLTLTLLGDFVSLYLAAMYEVDPENIDYINVLKAKLADVPF